MLAATACGGDDPPSCDEAITHYYDSGCTFVNGDTGRPTTQQEARSACDEIDALVPDRCRGEFESWLSCVNSTPEEAANNADCNCSSETQALVDCE